MIQKGTNRHNRMYLLQTRKQNCYKLGNKIVTNTKMSTATNTKMRTAMQELIEEFKHIIRLHESIQSELSHDRIQTYTNAIRLAESMLEKEQEQIKNAYIDGLGEHPVPFFSNFQAEQYYNETFGSNR